MKVNFAVVISVVLVLFIGSKVFKPSTDSGAVINAGSDKINDNVSGSTSTTYAMDFESSSSYTDFPGQIDQAISSGQIVQNSEQISAFDSTINDAESDHERLVLEKYILSAAAENTPVDVVMLGRFKGYYIESGNLANYQRFIESLPDSYEMKNEFLTDLAFLYQDLGYIHEATNLIQNVSYRDQTNVHYKYAKADLFWDAGYHDVAINTLIEANVVAEDPYQFFRIAEILDDKGDMEGSNYYQRRGDALESLMHHD